MRQETSELRQNMENLRSKLNEVKRSVQHSKQYARSNRTNETCLEKVYTVFER